jgi:hypothetical protein
MVERMAGALVVPMAASLGLLRVARMAVLMADWWV